MSKEAKENKSMESSENSDLQPVINSANIWSKTWPQHWAAGLAALAIVCAGAVDGWIAPAIPYLAKSHNITDGTVPGITYDQRSLIVSLSPLGSLFGALPAGYLADLLGRRFLILIMAGPIIGSWLMLLFGQNSVALLYIARFILGFACGVVSVALPLYCDEIAEVRVRGAVGSYLELMITVGVLYVYSFGAILPYGDITIACTVLPVLFAVTFYWMPESPLYLLTKGQTDKAKESLRWLRGVGTGHSAEIEGEMNEMESFIKRVGIGQSAENEGKLNERESLINMAKPSISVSTDQNSLRSSVINFFKSISVTPEILKSINIIFGLMAFRQLCGLNAILAYTVEVFESAGSAWDPYANTAVFGVIQFLSTLIAVLIVDRVGRRVLLIGSGAGMILSLLLLVIHIHLLDKGISVRNESSLPVIAVNLYILAFLVGLGPVPWFMMPELLNNKVRSWVCSLAVCFNWTMAFLVTRFFLVMLNVWGSQATYCTLLGVCVFGTVFVVVFVPETKMKTREQIHEQLTNYWCFVNGWHKVEEEII